MKQQCFCLWRSVCFTGLPAAQGKWKQSGLLVRPRWLRLRCSVYPCSIFCSVLLPPLLVFSSVAVCVLLKRVSCVAWEWQSAMWECRVHKGRALCKNRNAKTYQVFLVKRNTRNTWQLFKEKMLVAGEIQKVKPNLQPLLLCTAVPQLMCLPCVAASLQAMLCGTSARSVYCLAGSSMPLLMPNSSHFGRWWFFWSPWICRTVVNCRIGSNCRYCQGFECLHT